MRTKSIHIVVSHPRKQHVYELLKTFVTNNYRLHFYTTFWTTAFLLKSIQTLVPKTYTHKILKVLKKRQDNSIPESSVYKNTAIEILRLVSGKIRFNNIHSKAAFYLDRLFDKSVARKIKKQSVDIFIGYEMSSFNSFKQAKQQGAITILDLAQIHYKKIDILADEFTCLKAIKKDLPLYKKINEIKQKEYELADYIIVLSDFARISLLEQHIPANKIKLIHLGVNTTTFTPRSTYNTNETFRIIFAGTLYARKGIELLLTALIELNKIDIELIVVGAQLPSSPNLSQHQFPFKITHIPYATHEELNTLYHSADLFILPSYLDSFGMVVTEAMATGMPVIVTSNTGASDFVKQGGGKVIAIDSVEEIKTSILYYYTDRSRVQHDGLKAAEISRQYTWDYYRTCVAKTIDDILLDHSK